MNVSKHIVLCPNPKRDKDYKITLQARRMLEQAGYPVKISPIIIGDETGETAPPDSCPLPEAARGAALLVPLGGDGTMLHAARAVMEETVPIVGVNLGHKGFMTELEPQEMDKLIAAAAGDFTPSVRMMLDAFLIREGQVVWRDCALNDVALTGIVNMIDISAYSDDSRILDYSGDGIVVATPTGSTAYSMSAGGPLVEPEARNIILTPICPHVLNAKSFVLPPERRGTLKLGDMRGKRAVASCDGADPVTLQSGDRLVIERSAHVTLIAHLGDRSFYDTVYYKLGVHK